MQNISSRYNDNTDEFTILFVEKPECPNAPCSQPRISSPR